MNWLEKLTEFAKQLFQLQGRVEQNTEDIKALRQDLKELTDFTREVSYAVQRYRERQEHEQETLVLKLENQLLKLENRLIASNRLPQQDAPQGIRFLPDANGKEN